MFFLRKTIHWNPPHIIKTLCAKFRKQNHPNNTLLLTWAAFLSHFRPAILHDLDIRLLLLTKRARNAATGVRCNQNQGDF